MGAVRVGSEVPEKVGLVGWRSGWRGPGGSGLGGDGFGGSQTFALFFLLPGPYFFVFFQFPRSVVELRLCAIRGGSRGGRVRVEGSLAEERSCRGPLSLGRGTPKKPKPKPIGGILSLARSLARLPPPSLPPGQASQRATAEGTTAHSLARSLAWSSERADRGVTSARSLAPPFLPPPPSKFVQGRSARSLAPLSPQANERTFRSLERPTWRPHCTLNLKL